MFSSPSLRSEKINVERKQFFFDLKENARGRYLQITEDVNGRRDTIMVPVEALRDFQEIVASMIMHTNVRGNGSNGNGHHGNGDGHENPSRPKAIAA